MASLFGQQLTDMMMLDPWMFDPTQQSNQFSSFNNAPFPGPTYAAPPVNAATGQPLANFQGPPPGTTINSTPAPAAPPQQDPNQAYTNSVLTSAAINALPMGTPDAGGRGAYTGLGGVQGAGQLLNLQQQQRAAAAANRPPVDPNQSALSWLQSYGFGGGPGPTGTPAAAPQGSGGGQQGNWATFQQYLNALANPGNPVTPGATVPIAQGYQPAGGVNAAFLGSLANGGQGMNKNFLGALAAIQGRPA